MLKLGIWPDKAGINKARYYIEGNESRYQAHELYEKAYFGM